MSDQIPWYHVGKTYQSNPFASLGVDWCPRCRGECEADMACVYDMSSETFTYKKTCCRCGKVICHGIYNQVSMITNKPLPNAALTWCFESERDRR
jgi:hypothetical protein